MIEDGILSDVYDYDSCDPSVISDYVDDLLSELAIKFDKSEVEQISECCDFDEILQANMDAAMRAENEYEAYKEEWYSMESTTDAINDLFDRS